MNFVAIDVETANADMTSICQIGVVQFENGIEVASESRLIDPEMWFDEINVSIHGIQESMVIGKPNFCDMHDWLLSLTQDKIVVCHTHFDRISLSRSCCKHSRNELSCKWLDSARVTRRTWPEFSRSGYGLANVAAHLGIQFQHHDAISDARTAGLILLRSMEIVGCNLDDWVRNVEKPITPPLTGAARRRAGDGDGALVGEILVFTGALNLERRYAADRAADAGADVHPGVTKHTTVLVVGDQDIGKLSGKLKSSKHLKAEGLILRGQRIRIMSESDFLAVSAIVG